MIHQNIDKEYDIIVFDFDNTLFDYESTEQKALEEVFINMNLKYFDEYFIVFSNINRKLWDISEQNDFLDKTELRVQRFFNFFNEIGIVKELSFAKKASQIFIENSTSGYLIDGVEETLNNLKNQGFILLIASSGLANPRKLKLYNSSIREYFSYSFFREDFQDDKIKPHIDFYNSISNKYPNIPSKRFLYVGDSFESDIKGSKKAGFSNIWFNYFNKKESSVDMNYCDQVIYSFKDLILYI